MTKCGNTLTDGKSFEIKKNAFRVQKIALGANHTVELVHKSKNRHKQQVEKPVG